MDTEGSQEYPQEEPKSSRREEWDSQTHELTAEERRPLNGFQEVSISLGAENVIVKTSDEVEEPTLTTRVIVAGESEDEARAKSDNKPTFIISYDEDKLSVQSGPDTEDSVATRISHGGIQVTQSIGVNKGTLIGYQDEDHQIGVAKSSGIRREVELLVPANRELPYKLQTTSGKIELQGVTGSVDATTTMGNITLLDVGFRGRSKVATRMGMVDIRPRNSSLEVDITTGMGRITTPEGFTNTGDSAEGIIGTDPNPANRLRIKTSMGGITVRQ